MDASDPLKSAMAFRFLIVIVCVPFRVSRATSSGLRTMPPLPPRKTIHASLSISVTHGSFSLPQQAKKVGVFVRNYRGYLWVHFRCGLALCFPSTGFLRELHVSPCGYRVPEATGMNGQFPGWDFNPLVRRYTRHTAVVYISTLCSFDSIYFRAHCGAPDSSNGPHLIAVYRRETSSDSTTSMLPLLWSVGRGSEALILRWRWEGPEAIPRVTCPSRFGRTTVLSADFHDLAGRRGGLPLQCE